MTWEVPLHWPPKCRRSKFTPSEEVSSIFFPLSKTTVTTSFSATTSDISLSISDRVVVKFSSSAVMEASASVGFAAFSTEAEHGVCSIACSILIMRCFFWLPSLPSAAEEVSFFCKRLISSNPKGLSGVNCGGTTRIILA
jgi:hypothetical protein